MLTPAILLAAYSQGIFPMAEEDGQISWYDPNPRTIFPLDDRFHVPHTLAQTIRQGRFEVRVDTCFSEVMRQCAAPGPKRETTWINDEIIAVYTELHRLGFAHSVETWRDGQLVGGLYGVAVGGLFAGESMFSRMTDSSKVALVALVERLRARGYVLHDTQFTTPHLQRFGAFEISRHDYKRRLRVALTVKATFA
jgi:leucyl/phenylalanyl-tRNA--protein transferase